MKSKVKKFESRGKIKVHFWALKNIRALCNASVYWSDCGGWDTVSWSSGIGWDLWFGNDFANITETAVTRIAITRAITVHFNTFRLMTLHLKSTYLVLFSFVEVSVGIGSDALSMSVLYVDLSVLRLKTIFICYSIWNRTLVFSVLSFTVELILLRKRQ